MTQTLIKANQSESKRIDDVSLRRIAQAKLCRIRACRGVAWRGRGASKQYGSTGSRALSCRSLSASKTETQFKNLSRSLGKWSEPSWSAWWRTVGKLSTRAGAAAAAALLSMLSQARRRLSNSKIRQFGTVDSGQRCRSKQTPIGMQLQRALSGWLKPSVRGVHVIYYSASNQNKRTAQTCQRRCSNASSQMVFCAFLFC